MALLFPGIPGGPELLIILLLGMMFLVVPAVLLVGVYLLGKRRGRSESEDRE